MGDGNEGKKSLSKMEKLSLETNRYPRDLLQRFMASNQSQSQSQLALTSMSNEEEEEEEEEIELNLGLSLGGRFGVDRSPNKKKLMRSSSIAGSIPIVRDDDAVAPPLVSYPTLIRRTSSLPTETEEQRRKRKELQTLRRMEAKRRRSEKQRNLKGEKDGSGGSESERSLEDERREIEANLRGRIEREQYMAAARRLGSFGLPTWGAAARQAIPIIAGGKKGNYMGGSISISISSSSGGAGGFVQPIESQGGSSSGMSESESRPVQGSSSCGEASPGSIQSLQERSNQEAAGSSGAKGRENACNSSAEMESPSKRPEVVENRGREMGSNSMEDMPCVFTQGDGPNGRRIEGILYKYGKGEEVRIMCVCHGSFLSPAEFVKHAGGSDVAHPLKHIVVVNPASTSFL